MYYIYIEYSSYIAIYLCIYIYYMYIYIYIYYRYMNMGKSWLLQYLDG